MGVSNTISRLMGRKKAPTWTNADFAGITRHVDNAPAVVLPDRVLTAAIKAGVFAASDVPADGSWRLAAMQLPQLSNVLHRIAADTYGYRKVLICEMSTIVQADLLTVRLTDSDWEDLFRSGIVPVVEHGQAPLQDGRVVFASHDPGNPNIRSLAERIRSVRPRLVYADRDIVSRLQHVLGQNIPALGTLSTAGHSPLKKVHVQAEARMGRAA